MKRILRSKVATIVPKAHFDEILGDYYLMGLVHACEDKDYFNFFRSRYFEGKYVILDNSTVELGHPYDSKEYIEIADEIGAMEICLPDLLREKQTTLEESRKFIDLLTNKYGYKNWPFNLMAIPQGKTAAEWVDCAGKMSIMPIDTLGISCRYTEMFGNRCVAFSKILPIIRKKGLMVHLLGNYLPPEYEVAKLLIRSEVRGVDSSTPCVYTKEGLKLEGSNESPPHHHIDFIKDKYDESLLRQNIGTWRKRCMSWQP